MQEKVYAPLNLKEITTKYGPLLKLSFKAEKLEEFIKQFKNEKDYINININKRKEVGKYGETHVATLDTWKPDGEYIPKDKPVTDFVPEQDSTAADDLPF